MNMYAPGTEGTTERGGLSPIFTFRLRSSDAYAQASNAKLAAFMKSFRPRLELRDRVASIELIETPGGEVDILPGTAVVLGFQAQGRVRRGGEWLAMAGVTGIQGRLRTYDYVGSTTSLLVRFTPQGAACLGVPMSELADRSVALDAVMPKVKAQAREAHEKLVDAGTERERVAAIEDFLVQLPYQSDPLVQRAIELFEQGEGETRVAAVARSLSLSERQLERRFLKRVGITPKRFARLRRFERAVALARAARPLTTAALDAGYYDQSHFNRDFRAYAGGAPATVLRRAR